MADDHACKAVSAYGDGLNTTPNIDRLAAEGVRLDACFCTNALCAPSRASILTGTYSHLNGVMTLDTPIDAAQETFPAMLSAAGYQTAIFGKWHLGHGPRHDPRGFDTWRVLHAQGTYFDPEFLSPEGTTIQPGYVTDVITNLATEWIARRDATRPFCLLVHHKAPHVPREWDDAHAGLYADSPFDLPETFFDDFESRSNAARQAAMRISEIPLDRFKESPPPDATPGDLLTIWKYQQVMKDYLRCVASLDDNVGKVLVALESQRLLDDTIVIYTSDQGYFLGDHGWTDKRFMYEESLRMPFLIRYPAEVPAAACRGEIITNVDIAPTILDYAG
jgi:arylsulfatase A-like enzyme